MQETKGLLGQITHHDKVPITVNQNCAIALPDGIWQRLLQPHKLAYYYFVHTIADELAMTPNTLYGLVKEISGLSPKEWMTTRLMQEAQRKLRYASPSVKELAYELGFNDPAYFPRLFKKKTGKNISDFLTDQHNLSTN